MRFCVTTDKKMQEVDRKRLSVYGKFSCGLFIFIFLAIGCAQTEKEPVSKGQTTLHKVRSATLRAKMRSLKMLLFDNIYDELQFDEERARQVGNIAEIANSIAVTAMDVSSISQDLSLDAESETLFRGYAQDLKNQAIALQEATRQERSDVYPSMIKSIINICNRCHSRFR